MHCLFKWWDQVFLIFFRYSGLSLIIWCVILGLPVKCHFIFSFQMMWSDALPYSRCTGPDTLPDSRKMRPLTTNVGNWNHSEIDPSCWKLLATLERLQYTEQSCLRIRVGMWFSARVVDPSIIIMHYWSWNRLTIKVNKMSHTPVCFACTAVGRTLLTLA